MSRSTLPLTSFLLWGGTKGGGISPHTPESVA